MRQKEDFDTYYRNIWLDRWDALKDATSPVTFVCGIGTLAAGVVGIIMAIAE